MEVNNNFNKSWKIHGKYDDYTSAAAVKTEILQDETMQAKIRRRSTGKFVVKTRVSPEHQIKLKEQKKNGKSKRRNKKTTGGGESNTPTSV